MKSSTLTEFFICVCFSYGKLLASSRFFYFFLLCIYGVVFLHCVVVMVDMFSLLAGMCGFGLIEDQI